MHFLTFKYNTSYGRMVCLCVPTAFGFFFSGPRGASIERFRISLVLVQGRWGSSEQWKFLLVSCCPGMCLCGFHHVKMTYSCLISQRRERNLLLSPGEGIFLMDMYQRHAYLIEGAFVCRIFVRKANMFKLLGTVWSSLIACRFWHTTFNGTCFCYLCICSHSRVWAPYELK